MKTTVCSKGQIVLPAEFRQMDGVEPGQEFDEGAIDWLLACPRKGFFVNRGARPRRAASRLISTPALGRNTLPNF